MLPDNAISAASHANPYPYYASLRKGPALLFDHELGMWIASRAAVIHEVLANPDCAVRPATQAVPHILAGSSAGTVFAHLVRMNEGAAHGAPKLALQQGLAQIDLAATGKKTAELALLLGQQLGLLTPWIDALPGSVVASLLGLDREQLPQLLAAVGDLVRGFAPHSDMQQAQLASEAARHLLGCFAQLLQPGAMSDASLLGQIRQQALQLGWGDSNALPANLIGLLLQTHEATAGLIGNSIVALLGDSVLQSRVRRDLALIPALVREVARHDAPVQNTRRWVRRATTIAGIALAPDAAILLVLASASRDEQLNCEPNQLILDRADRKIPGFGDGRHACPAQDLAFVIAAAAIESLLSMPIALDPQTISWHYRPLANGRLPIFHMEKT